MIREWVEAALKQGAPRTQVYLRLGITQRTLQRWKLKPVDGRRGPLTSPANKLTQLERALIISTANNAEFRDVSPKQMVPRLADRGVYLGSESTVSRVLAAEGLMAHRGFTKPPAPRPRPELVANAANQVWTWDITYLRSPIRGAFFYLYMVTDIFSRRIVGWEVHDEETSERSGPLLQRLFAEVGRPKGLSLHADNGAPMRGATMLATIQKLGIAASFSRPRVSNDNPFSEALFRTVKYCALYPEKPFASLEAARSWVTGFSAWYNTQHRHSALRFVTPNERHNGLDHNLLAKRHELYQAARRRNPNRWSRQTRNWSPVAAVRIGAENNLRRISRH